MLDILFMIFVFLVFIMLFFLRIIMEYEKGVKFTLGKFSSTMHPGLNFVIPILQSYRKVDMRIKTIDVPKQEVMTSDNVPAQINAVVYFKVDNAENAVLKIQDYVYAVSQYAQTALRDVIGSITLDSLLTKREEIASEIKLIVDKETDPWGIDVTAIKIQDVELPQDMKRVMAKQAEAEREKRAVIIKSGGEVIAANNLSKAAKILAEAPGALHLRTLNTLNDLSSDQSNTVIFAIPIETLRAIEGLAGKIKKK